MDVLVQAHPRRQRVSQRGPGGEFEVSNYYLITLPGCFRVYGVDWPGAAPSVVRRYGRNLILLPQAWGNRP